MKNKIDVEKLKHADICDFFDMRDLVFSKTIFGKGFDSFAILPDAFNLTEECAENHWIVRSEGGRIVAGAGSVPAVMNIAGERIAIGKVTGVATHLREGGKGYFSAIMNEIRAYYAKEGVAASYLMGERKRYQHFGYEKTGVSYDFSIRKKNIEELSLHGDGIVHLYEMKRDDAQAIDFAKQLHDSDIISIERSRDRFYTLLTHCYNKPYIAKSGDGEYAGYIVFDNGLKCIQEIYAKTPALFEAMIGAAVAERGDLSLILPPWRSTYIYSMMRICENYIITNGGNWLINDWEPLVRALMKAKAAYMGLPDGRLIIGINGYGALNIEVRDNTVACTRSCGAPDFTADAFTASRLIFGHGSQAYVAEMPGAAMQAILAWFPLPLFCPNPDAL
jgi:hypothetical protein